ncbi:hypothetical protein [Rhodococcus sp. NPDC049939]|uniref:hypothetical protein n=1 Tax=Rhodococcus sp. NPDC049939 TaxID=3155511 RepID=UPI00340AE98B
MRWDELLDRLFDRYTDDLDEDALRRLERNVAEDALPELIAFIETGMDRGDLRDDEIDTALDLARRNRLLKSSQALAKELEKLKASRSSK